jgi:hypothetical protein
MRISLTRGAGPAVLANRGDHWLAPRVRDENVPFPVLSPGAATRRRAVLLNRFAVKKIAVFRTRSLDWDFWSITINVNWMLKYYNKHDLHTDSVSPESHAPRKGRQ